MNEAISEYEKVFRKGIPQKNKEAHKHNIKFYAKQKNAHMVKGIRKQLRNFDRNKIQKGGELIDIENIELLEEYVYPCFSKINLIKVKRAYNKFNIDDSSLINIILQLIKNIQNLKKIEKKNKSKNININITDDEIIEKYTYALFENIDLIKIKKDYASSDIKDFNSKDIMSQLIWKIQALQRKEKSDIPTHLHTSDIILLEKYAPLLFDNVDIYKMKQDYDFSNTKSFSLRDLMYQLIIKINDYRFELNQYHIDIMPFIQIHRETNMRFIKSSPRNKKRISKTIKQYQVKPKKPKITDIHNFLIGKHLVPLTKGDEFPICKHNNNLNKNDKTIKKINSYIKEKTGSYQYTIGSCKEIDKYIYDNKSNYNYLKEKTNEIKSFLKELKTNENMSGLDLITYSTYLKNN